MGGRPLVALNLLAWPSEVLPFELAAEVLRGGLDVWPRGDRARRSGPVAAQRLRAGQHAAVADQAAGLGMLNSRHKATGQRFEAAVQVMTTLNAGAAEAALDAVDEDTALLLADAQTSGGLLLAGEVPGAPVIGELVSRVDGRTIVIR